MLWGLLKIIGWLALSLFGIGCIPAIYLAIDLIPLALQGRAENLGADTFDDGVDHARFLRR